MTISDKPAPGHPAPVAIRVKSIRRDSIKGFDELTIEAPSFVPVPSLPALKAQIEAAPEMETLLRRAMFETQPNGVCGDIHETDDWRQRGLALLDSIDAARKAGG